MIRIHAIAALMVPGLLLAQTTTWTSFTDRRGHAMARAQNGQVVTFGGQATGATGALLEDTHQFTQAGGNSSWSALQDGPEARTEHAMAAAQVNGQPDFIVFGGVTTASATPTNGTFRYRGNGWHDVHPPIGSPVPPARLSHGMVNHLGSQTLLMFGGFDGNQALGDLWEFLPAIDTWQQRQPTGTGPSARSEHCMAYCAANQKVYVYGGTPFQGDLYEYDLALDSWQQKLPPGTVPPGRRKAAMAYVNGAGGIVMFGGLRFGTVLGDTWYYDPLANQWTQLTFTQPTPPARYDHAVAIDGTGNKLVLLGGTDNGSSRFESTWQFDSNTFEWAEILPAPTPRDGVAMAYDSSRGRHVVFGGRSVTSGADLEETWEIEGLNWRKRTASTRPLPRSDAGMAFDEARNTTMLYGGRSQATGLDLGDAWEWNGVTWTPRTFPTTPPVAGGSPLVYDSLLNRTCLLIGNTLWFNDGVDWHAATDCPVARSGAAYCYDTNRGRVVMFGGASGYPITYLADTWEWDGATWHLRVSGGPTPPARHLSAMTYDAVRQVALMSGGVAGPGVSYADCWTWNGASWTQVASHDVQSWWGMSMAFDASRGKVVMFGGVGGATGGHRSNATYEWDGGWAARPTPVSPPGRSSAAMAYDPSRARTILFGGYGAQASPLLGDTWEYDGATWTPMSPSSPPPPGMDGLLCYDTITNQMLLYLGSASPESWLWNGVEWNGVNMSGQPGQIYRAILVSTGTRTIIGMGADPVVGGVRADLWEWSGAAWELLDSGKPSARTNHGLVYDSRRNRVVLFGGMTANSRSTASYNSETWEWNGSVWLRRFPASQPAPRGWCTLAYDHTRSRVVLFGGADAVNTFQDTWEWDGVNWLQRTPVAIPSGAYGHNMTFDKAREVTVAYGSFGAWDYGPVHAASTTSYGTGCPTSASNPAGAPLTILPKPWAGPWLGDRFEADFANQPANSLGIFLWGFSDQLSLFGPLPVNLGFLGSPSCNMLASAEVTEILLPGTTTYTSFVLPNHPSFLGAVMFGQAGFFDAGNGGLPVTSNGLRLTFGQK